MKRINFSKNVNFVGSWNIDDNKLCAKIIDIFENRKDLQRKGVTGYGKDEKAKKSTDISLDPKSIIEEEFVDIKTYIDKLYQCYQDYKDQWPFLKQNITTLDIPSFNIQKYEPGGHYNLMHCERGSLQSMHRVFAWMTYLNDVEDGGETYFKHFDLKIKPKTGNTLIWPAEWTHAHKGETLNKGNKYIITGWMHFPFNF
jgi:prolyl 4-hydroxylase